MAESEKGERIRGALRRGAGEEPGGSWGRPQERPTFWALDWPLHPTKFLHLMHAVFDRSKLLSAFTPIQSLQKANIVFNRNKAKEKTRALFMNTLIFILDSYQDIPPLSQDYCTQSSSQ